MIALDYSKESLKKFLEQPEAQKLLNDSNYQDLIGLLADYKECYIPGSFLLDVLVESLGVDEVIPKMRILSDYILEDCINLKGKELTIGPDCIYVNLVALSKCGVKSIKLYNYYNYHSKPELDGMYVISEKIENAKECCTYYMFYDNIAEINI